MAAEPQQGTSEEFTALGQRLADGKWIVVGVVCEGDAIYIDSENLWAHKWESLKAHLELPHPAYPNQHHRMDVYRITVVGRSIVFAAGELSANVWGFYRPG